MYYFVNEVAISSVKPEDFYLFIYGDFSYVLLNGTSEFFRQNRAVLH